RPVGAGVVFFGLTYVATTIVLTHLNGEKSCSEKTLEENPVMKTVSYIAQYLAGVIFLVFGLNGFLHFIPLPPPEGVAGQFMGALFVSHYLAVIFAVQVIGALLLIVNRFVPLALTFLAPVLVNILTFHALMAPSG